jgi:hypothetical protein
LHTCQFLWLVPPPPIVVGGRLLAALHENSPDALLARGMPSSNVEELLCGLGLVMAELVHQGSVVYTRPERQYDVSIVDLGEFVTLSGGTPNVIT